MRREDLEKLLIKQRLAIFYFREIKNFDIVTNFSIMLWKNKNGFTYSVLAYMIFLKKSFARMLITFCIFFAHLLLK